MYVLKREKQIQAISMLAEGASIRSAERVVGAHRDTIMRLMVRTGENCSRLLDEHMRNLKCDSLQIDEVHTWVKLKAKRMTWFESIQHPEWGDQFVFVAIDSETKLVPGFLVGKRDAATTMAFMQLLRARVPGRTQITTDAFKTYRWAIGNTYGRDAAYAQQIKVYKPVAPGRGRYSPPEVRTVETNVLWGSPDPNKISTSFIERQNLSLRNSTKRLARLTICFSKKRENLIAALNVYYAVYNFVRVHRTLKTTPAVAAGVSNRVWTIDELVA